MSVGYPVDKNVLDQRAGSLALQLRDTLEECQRFKQWLDGKQDADLLAFNYQQGDVDTLRAAFTDLDKLARIANAQADQDEPNDFFFWADRLTGVQ